ncbi:adenine deaminase [Alicyclobacillus cellulosilyticus]|uniref:Adenine deaminase n=1 Tax=Alicyclobacillus cellulosilyticus TaxID=1003997 RepID=A0A917KIS5_9BACL|nr:adenine deaminase [Alicyclobacillus cellulosilyticus]GGJ13301.1 adenine deaminase [Alicyclobacillus cellulosilyticus]
MRTVQELETQLRTARGLEPADLALINVKWVNVHSEEILPGAVYVKAGRIVAFHQNHCLESITTVDCQGRYVVPGFIDGHVHIEPTLLTPQALSEVIVPHGTTTLLADGMEIANVAGVRGLRALLEQSIGKVPYNLWLQVPSRVPTAPGLETTGATLGVTEVRELLTEDYAVSCGELDPSKVLQIQREYLEKVMFAQAVGKIANGHAIGLDWTQMNVYACAGLADDHECVTFEEAVMRVRLGMSVLIREGSTERNLDTLIASIVSSSLNTEQFAFCTDDKHANDIMREGHINYMVRRAIELGIPPIKAIKMATLNTARHFRIDHEVGSLTPGRRADIVILEDLCSIQPYEVYVRGRLVAKEGRLTIPVSLVQYPEYLRRTVRLNPQFSSESLRVSASGTTQLVRVINVRPDQITNVGTVEKLSVVNGEVQNDVNRDILKLAVIERYGKSGGVGVGFVHGFGLKTGALGSSVAHDHHNIVVVGVNDADMALAARVIEQYQGALVAVSDGKVRGVLPLPVAGLMSDKPAREVIKSLEDLNRVAAQMGCMLPAPFMTLSFISLPTVPELGMTDQGLIDVKAHRIISVLVNR